LLSVPVGQGNREDIVSTVEGLEPLGRTPIGRSLREAPDDFPEDAGRRTVVLVSDGGDNCAPPDPCEAAEDVAQQGVELTINVIGLQVSERVREELQCIAGAGGGVYADAENPEELTQELRAAFARSLRDYEPTGTPVEGGPQPGQAAVISEGQFLDDIGAGRQRWYEVRVEPGQRVWTTAVALIPEGVQGSGGLEVRLLDSAGEEVDDEITLIDDNGGVNGPYSPQGLRGPPAGSQGGVYRIGVSLSTAFPDTVGLPMELLVYALDDGEAPGDIGPGRVLTGVEDEDGSPPERRDGDRPGTDREGDSGGDWPPAALGLGVVGLALGGIAGWTGVRRRRRRGS
jgi:Ca-activated chloride channel family protein